MQRSGQGVGGHPADRVRTTLWMLWTSGGQPGRRSGVSGFRVVTRKPTKAACSQWTDRPERASRRRREPVRRLTRRDPRVFSARPKAVRRLSEGGYGRRSRSARRRSRPARGGSGLLERPSGGGIVVHCHAIGCPTGRVRVLCRGWSGLPLGRAWPVRPRSCARSPRGCSGAGTRPRYAVLVRGFTGRFGAAPGGLIRAYRVQITREEARQRGGWGRRSGDGRAQNTRGDRSCPRVVRDGGGALKAQHPPRKAQHGPRETQH
ncbi:hypothetical protein LY13_004420, partial [Prauserella aidingensis]|nr:hypothetical protein [Prauserella aidingensis]